MKHKVGDEVRGKFSFRSGDDAESSGRIIKVDSTSMSVPHYTVRTYDGRIAGAYEDDLFEAEG